MTPAGARASAQRLCHRAVALERLEAKTVGAAIGELSRRGSFGSWLRKLYHDETVTIHLHHYERLVALVVELAAEKRAQLEHIETLRAARGKRHAAIHGDLRTDLDIDLPEVGRDQVGHGGSPHAKDH